MAPRTSHNLEPQPAETRRPPRQHRNPFVEKRLQRRKIAQARTMAHVRVPLTSQIQPHRGLHRLPSWVRLSVGILVLVASVALHVGFVVMAFGVSRLGSHKTVKREQVAIEVREQQAKPKEEKPPEKPPEPEVKPERVVAVRQAPTAKPEVQPKELPKAAPARVVGLSFESTVGEGEGGDGPAFGVGNTRMGETAKTAAAPKEVPKEIINKGATTTKPSANAVATRIPVAGVEIKQPKRKKEIKPDFPPTLKAQGIEGDVPVIVWVNEEGKVTSVKILKESPYPEFNEAAKKSAMNDDYEPATRNGVPIPYTLKFNVSFRLVD